ncbi:MAG: hypothetical protein D6B28_11645 [Gammaproteobacteria bacterium]|nr:MAG: hypothetical protein D6B28_11645 [Gammaproteobacteria bacterium]
MKKIILLALLSSLFATSVIADDYSADANQMAREYLEHKRKMELLKRAQEEARIKQEIARQYKQCISTGVAVEECDALIANMGAASGSTYSAPSPSDQRYFNRTDSSGEDSGEGSASMELLKKLQNEVEDMKAKKSRTSSQPVKANRKSVRVPKMLRVVSGKVVFKTSEGEVSARAGDTLPGGFVLQSFSLTRAVLTLDGARYESEISW